MKTVYLPLDEKNAEGKFYTEFQAPEGLPLGDGVIYVGPDENLQYPKYDQTKGEWVEDKDSIIESFKEQITDMQSLLAQFYEGGLS